MGFAVALFGIVMLVLVLRTVFGEMPARRGARAIHLILGGIFLYGCLGFFGQAAAAAGGLSFLSSSFEWPPLWPEANVRDGAGNTILGLASTGRIQVYDSQNQFVRGWFIPASGGSFTVLPTTSGNIEVFTARRRKHLLYALTGALLADTTYAPRSFDEVSARAARGARIVAPIPLWPLANPFVAWSLCVVGMVGTALPDWRRKAMGRP